MCCNLLLYDNVWKNELFIFFNHPTSMYIRDVQNKHTEDDYHQFIWLNSTSTDVYSNDSLALYCNSLPTSIIHSQLHYDHSYLHNPKDMKITQTEPPSPKKDMFILSQTFWPWIIFS